ncbi:MAG: LysR family transcriptional regulator [Methanobacteriota archaeon]|nr:MAG: LysR family transcriptional regulator [Euryarchaeota archaeon]
MKSARLVPKIRILIGAVVAIGPGKADLLAAIARTGSISAAAREMKMSYRRAWLLVDTMNRCFEEPVVAAEAGGKRGGGTRLTATGRRAIAHYRRIEQLAVKASAGELRSLVKLMRRSGL